MTPHCQYCADMFDLIECRFHRYHVHVFVALGARVVRREGDLVIGQIKRMIGGQDAV